MPELTENIDLLTLIGHVMAVASLLMNIWVHQAEGRAFTKRAVVSCPVAIAHFLCFKDFVSAGVIAVNMGRFLCASLFPANKGLMVIFLALVLVVGGLLWDGPRSLLPIIGGLIGVYSCFMFGGARFRWATVAANLCYVLNAALIGSFVFVCVCLTNIGIHLLKIRREG